MKNNRFHGPNLAHVLDLYERYRQDPERVGPADRDFFADWSPPPDSAGALDRADLQVLSGAANLAQAIRTYGYLAADLDPLGSDPVGDPLLTLEHHGLREADLRALPAGIAGITAGDGARDAYTAVRELRAIYSGRIGYDYGHIHRPEEREWLYGAAESGRFRPPAEPVDGEALLRRLVRVEAFELFLHRRYPGKTRFSIEGLDMLVPMLDAIVGAAARGRICAVLLGMAHRGRLNVLAHVLGKPYEEIFAEFADPKGRATTWDELGWTGDVKYHLGGFKPPGEGDEIDLVICMPANPSHLEQIDPVILGMARAANSVVDAPGPPKRFANASLPVMVHGDAAFTGQGVVAETLNLSRLPGYSAGGSIHIIANNQLGFTAEDAETRSSLRASDPARGYEMPIIHANADDPVACLEAARTAYAYRRKFHKAFVINLIGYRRYGHNEGDEPRFTQPVMYRVIDRHPTVRELWAERLESANGEAVRSDEMIREEIQRLQAINEALDPEEALEEPVPQDPPPGAAHAVETAVALERLRDLNDALLQFPADFELNSKLKKAVERRRSLFENGDAAAVEWATAEELALATILADGIAVRIAGQDSVRGTFSQRHAAFYDAETGAEFVPLASFPGAEAAFEIHNSPLSEAAALGFEFGYNVQAPERLAIWEAQYGDFINNAQTVVDEFLLAGRAKWGLTPSLVLLLPHGNEGMGPDHSSARIERFLGLAAEKNVRIANPSTAAQYFHLLRRQALLLVKDPLPLVVFTPKGLLRHPRVSSKAADLAGGRWRPVIPDGDREDEDVTSLILCSGRIYIDLVQSDRRDDHPDTAVARLEQLYPFPQEALEDLLDGLPALERVVWAQEEPLNMGAWDFLRPRLRELAGDLPLRAVGRPASSSPAEGSTTMYRVNQAALIERAYAREETAAAPGVAEAKE